MKIARLTRRIALAVAGSAVALGAVGVTGAQAGVRTDLTVQQLPISARPTLHYFAPTEDLTAVANSLTLTSKSTTTDVRASAGLHLDHPVAIRVSYTAHGPQVLHAVSRGYDSAAGTNLVWSYPAASPNEFRVGVQITLSEVISPSDTETFSINWQPILRPLYDVFISPLTFTLTSYRGFSDTTRVDVTWTMPTDGPAGRYYGDATVGQPKVFPTFAAITWRYPPGPMATFPTWRTRRCASIPIPSSTTRRGGPPRPSW